MTVITRAGRDSNFADAVYCAGASALASHAVVFRGLVSRGGGNTTPLKTTAWEATSAYYNVISVSKGAATTWPPGKSSKVFLLKHSIHRSPSTVFWAKL